MKSFDPPAPLPCPDSKAGQRLEDFLRFKIAGLQFKIVLSKFNLDVYSLN